MHGNCFGTITNKRVKYSYLFGEGGFDYIMVRVQTVDQ